MHSANNERPSKGALHPIQESAQTAQAVSEISKGLQCALTAITIVALWHIYIYIYIYIYITQTFLVISWDDCLNYSLQCIIKMHCQVFHKIINYLVYL